MYVSVNDMNIHVKTAGSGPPLVLLHGFTGAASNWQPFFSLWREYFRVIAVDIIGHGTTDAPVDAARYAMDRVVCDLAALMDRLNIERADVLGYSMGGRLALTLAADYPQRVNKLLLESSSPGLKTKRERIERIKRDEALADRIERYGVESFVNDWEKVPLFATQSESARRTLRRQRLQNRAHGLANSLRGMGTGAQKPLWGKLPSIQIPVQLMVGERDDKFCRIAKEMDEALPHSGVRVVSGAGHAIHVEQPRIFGKMVIESFK